MADDLVMEEREELMVSPTGGQVALGRAHFLKPTVTSLAGPVAAPSLTSCPAPAPAAADLPLNVSYQGCKNPSENWKAWVDQMHALHHSTWKNAGIADAIMNSKCLIHRYDDLIFGFVEKWCDTTNSFVFPWGEASVTLEDVMVLGGYPVLGEGVLAPARDEETEQLVKKLQKSRSSITKTNAKKACLGKWMTRFMGSGSEIEHQAFLAYWLSRFVFPFTRDTIGTNVLVIAVNLGRGFRIALAPAVLSAIYKGLSLLKAAIVAARKSNATNSSSSSVQVTVPRLALVQVWIWERFPSLRPKPEPVGSKPGLARWHNLKLDSSLTMTMTIDSAGKDFQWRPYTNGMIYRDGEQWVKVESDLDEDLIGFVRCVRACELVGLQGLDRIEQYLPHRVAMQFGMDQDLPGHVARVNVNLEIAWSDYIRPIRDAKIYVPARLSQPRVTARYAKWWKKLNLGWSGKTTPWEDSKLRVKKEFAEEDDDDVPPPGFSPKRKRRVEDAEKLLASRSPLYSWTRPRKLEDDDDDAPAPPGFPPKRKRLDENSSAAAASDSNDSDVPLGFPPKHKDYGVKSSSSSDSKLQAAQLSSNGINNQKERLLVESSKVKCEDGEVQGSKSRALGKELKEKITHIEKLIAVLKAGFC